MCSTAMDPLYKVISRIFLSFFAVTAFLFLVMTCGVSLSLCSSHFNSTGLKSDE